MAHAPESEKERKNYFWGRRYRLIEIITYKSFTTSIRNYALKMLI